MIDYELREKPKGVTVVEGFPSFGLVSTIALEFLIDHLDVEQIGEFVYDDLSPTVAIHDGELIHPMSIYYDEDHDLVILHTSLNVQGLEWEVAECIDELAEELDAREVISVEGVPTDSEDTQAFTYEHEGLKDSGAEPLEESIIMGVTAALMLRTDKATPLFSGAHSQLPDGEAAAEVIEVLKEYLDLDIDPEPLIKKAEEFENNLKEMMQQSQEAQKEADKRRLSYLG